MNDFDQFERQLGDALRVDADLSVGPFDPASVARAAIAGTGRRAGRLPRASSRPTRQSGRGRGITLLAAAALMLVGGALAAGSGLLRLQSVVPPEPVPSLAADATPSPAPTETSPSVPVRAGSWVATGSMGERYVRPGSQPGRSDHIAVRLLDGRVLVAGGGPAENDTSAELYDPVSGTWSDTGNMARPRANTGFAFGAILLRDGRVLAGDDQGAEVYDPVSGTWTATGKMVGRDGGSATLLRDGRVLVVHAGGSSELYDPDSETWSATGQLNTSPYYTPTPILLPDGRVLVAGGEDMSDGDRAALYDPATGTWTATGPMGTPRLEHLAVPLLDGRVLVVGGGSDDQGDTSAEVYDPAAGTWSATGSMIKPHTRFPATVLDDGTVLVGDADGAELYDPDSGTWSVTEKMVIPTSGSATLLLDGTVLVAGSGGSAELYIPAGVSPPPAVAVTPSAGIWIATGTMGTPRSGTMVRLLDGRVLVVGGANDENDTSAELYDPGTGTWSATGSMIKPHADGFPATLLPDGRVLAGDIDDPDADEPVFGAEVYDPDSGTWAATGKMVKAYPGTATLLRDGRVLVTGWGGSSSQLYDPDSGTWISAGKMVTASSGHAATLLPDGKVLVVGGSDAVTYALASAELYDPATGTWTAIAPMHGAKSGITATLLRDGKVLVTGRTREVRSVELFDPATGTWTTTGTFARPDKNYGSATLLSDGTVLVADDYGAEVYDPGTGSWTTTGYPLRGHDGPLTLLLDGTVLVAGGSECPPDRDGHPVQCFEASSAELYVPAGVSPPSAVLALPSSATTPSPTPSPSPSPTPVPPAVGPVPPGARTWTVTVMNKSSQPATLFVAEDDGHGLGPLVGSATPNVVAAGTTVKVTFLVPAKGTGWAIFVNPEPDGGSLRGPDEMSLPGQIYINPSNQPGWLSP